MQSKSNAKQSYELETFIITYLLTYLLTPWCRVLLEKLTGLQLVKKFPAFHGTRRFITALTSVRHLSLSWAGPIQSIYPHPTCWRSTLILSTHLRLGLPSGETFIHTHLIVYFKMRHKIFPSIFFIIFRHHLPIGLCTNSVARKLYLNTQNTFKNNYSRFWYSWKSVSDNKMFYSFETLLLLRNYFYTKKQQYG